MTMKAWVPLASRKDSSASTPKAAAIRSASIPSSRSRANWKGVVLACSARAGNLRWSLRLSGPQRAARRT